MLYWSIAMAGPMTPTQAMGDLDAIVERLEAMYVHPERVEDEEFQSRISDARMKIATVENTRDFWLATSPALAALKDAHTYLVPPLYTEGAPQRVAIDLDLRDGHVYLVGEDGIPKDPIRVLTMGDEDADAVMERWLEHFPGEHRAFQETWIEDDFEHLYPWWTNAETLPLSLEDGSTRTVKVKGVGTAAARTEKPISWERRGNLMELRIATFRADEKLWKKDLKTFFKELQSEPAAALVIDVRGNRGGPPERLEELLPYLAESWRVYSRASVREPQKDGTWSKPQPKEIGMEKGQPAFTGPVYVVTDATTFSTGSDLAASLSDLKRATVVGEVPGGMPTSSGNMVEVELPSGQKMFVATAAYVRADPAKGDGPLVVDLPCKPDDALEKIREHLTGQ